MPRQQRRLAAILAADVSGYSRMMASDEATTLKALTDCRALFSAKADGFGGRIVNAPGDSILAEFGSVTDAVDCALDLQRSLDARNGRLPEAQHMRFRIGVNLGDVLIDQAGIYGDGVNVAARLESIADPGGICVSDRVFEQVCGRVECVFEDLGSQRLKNIDRPVRAWKWVPGAAPDARKAGFANVGRMAHALPDRPSIAVLPFATIGAGAEREFFADGITEDIITELSRFRDLFVIARNSSFVYKGKAVKVQQVAEDLGVRYVLEGSVQWAGEQIRITAQLVDALSGGHIWANKYDCSTSDALGVRDEVTADIVAHLGGYHGELVKAEKRRSRRADATTLAAYERYLRGIEIKHRFNKADNLLAREQLQQVIAMDPEFARAYTGEAWTWLFDVWWGWGDDPAASVERARELAEKSAVLDDLDAEVHWLLGEVYIVLGQFERTELEYRRAFELNPNLADVYANWGMTAGRLGNPEKGLESVRKAMRLNPNCPDWYTQFLGMALYLVKRYDEAVKTLRQVKTHAVNTRLYLAAAHARLGEAEEAKAQIAQAHKLVPGLSWHAYSRAERFRNPEHLAHLAEGVALAGLK